MKEDEGKGETRTKAGNMTRRLKQKVEEEDVVGRRKGIGLGVE
jgi:hypothetical protein